MTEPDVEIPSEIDGSLETNLYQIAEKVCSEPPKEPCSIQLMLDHESDESGSDLEFEILSTFTLGCMRTLFGEDTTPCDLDAVDYQLLNAYVNSVGYCMNVSKEETENTYQFNITFKPYVTSKQNPYEHLKKYM